MNNKLGLENPKYDIATLTPCGQNYVDTLVLTEHPILDLFPISHYNKRHCSALGFGVWLWEFVLIQLQEH